MDEHNQLGLLLVDLSELFSMCSLLGLKLYDAPLQAGDDDFGGRSIDSIRCLLNL